jgi:hypothetical protein
VFSGNDPHMKDIFFFVIVPVIAALSGAILMPLIEAIRRSRESTYDDKQSVRGKYNCHWYVDESSGERLYAQDTVEIKKITGSKLFAAGRDPRFYYNLEGNISRGGILAFYYIIINKPMSLTGSLTLMINPSGSKLEGRWYGYVSEGRLLGGRVVWDRVPDIETRP